MVGSRLEVYLDILKVLARCGPLKLTLIMHQTEINYQHVKQCLELLIKQNLVEAKLVVGKRNIYHITEGGIAVLETLSKLENTLKISMF